MVISASNLRDYLDDSRQPGRYHPLLESMMSLPPTMGAHRQGRTGKTARQ